MHIAHRVQQSRHLFLAGFDDIWIGVAGGGDAECAGQIQIFFSVGVPDKNVFGALPDNRPRTVRFAEQDVARLMFAQQLQ